MHTLSFLPGVRYWTGSERKNAWLRQSGRPSFEAVVAAIESGGLKGSLENPSHPGQRRLVVMIDGYAHAVPYRLKGDTMVLITVYPSRVLHREFGESRS